MKNIPRSISAFLVVIIFLNSSPMKAQSSKQEENQILLTGKIVCVDPVNGELSSVVVYNLNKKFGTMTNEEGEYSIQMGKNDTIMFSTAEHKESLFYLNTGDAFENRTYDVHMTIDEVWHKTANIMGASNLTQFKQEIIDLNMSTNDFELALPVVNKYIKLTPLSAGEIDLEGPLTYLHKKFNRHAKFKKQVK